MFVCATSNADNRKWDFTNWSAATVANLAADMSQNADARWSDDEKGNGTRQNGNCYWWVPAGTASITTLVDGEEKAIPELDGLDFTGYKARSLAIAVNYPSTSLGTYAGGSYLWLGSKSQSFKIPAVKTGAKIVMEVESHKPSDGRGVALKVGDTSITISEGSEKPTEKTTCTWIIPTDISEEETVDVTVTNNNGCHLYSIAVWESGSEIEEDKKVAYIYNSTDYDENNDYAWAVLSGLQGIQMTQIDIANGAAEVTADSLESGYDAVVISPYVNATDAYVSTLKSIIAYEPVLNLNPSLYAAWGYGNELKGETNIITIQDELNALFEDENVAGIISEEKTIEWLADGAVTGVQLGEYFADDDTLATVGAGVAIHKHNDGRNSYLFLPYAKEDMANIQPDAMQAILPAAVNNVAKTKKEVTAVVTPTISEEYGNNQTTITISCANSKAKVYYTIDGSEPSEASTLYAEPFVLTEAKTVKAIAYADGYTVSGVAELTATIKQQAATPTIAVAMESGKSTVTISSATEGTTVYYNYTGSDATTESKVYSEPIVVTSPVTITAFATGDNYVNSELASQYVDVQDAKLRYDILSQFDANYEDWALPEDSTGSKKATYLFSWGKKSQSMYDTTQPGETVTVMGDDGQPLKDANGNDSTVVKYPEIAAESKTNGEWTLESQGQVITWENTSPKYDVGDGSNYNPETPEDAMLANDSVGITAYMVNFGGKTSGEPYNARLRSNKAFAGPFDIVVYASNGNGSNYPQIQIQTSADGTVWDSLSTVKMAETKRLWKRTQVSYESETPVYVRLAHIGGGTKGIIYNVYLLNAGTHTQEYITGIVDINSGNAAMGNISHIYNLNGVRQSSLQHGVNIVRYANGAVRKVMGK